MRRPVVVPAAPLLLAATPAFAWDDLGHAGHPAGNNAKITSKPPPTTSPQTGLRT
jgi:hypothetical protein